MPANYSPVIQEKKKIRKRNKEDVSKRCQLVSLDTGHMQLIIFSFTNFVQV